MAKYDVFISCKSEDYKFSEEIYDFLTENGVNTFLASKELRKLGESEYRRAISTAMKDAYHIIVFASRPEYVDSTWVYYEWDMFINAKLKGFKPGNIVTILKDISTNDINMDLWKYESLTYENYKETLLRYVETEESRRRQAEIAKAREEQERRRQQEEEKRRKAEAMRKELTVLAENYRKNLAALAVDAEKIFNMMKTLGMETRKCPVCDSDFPVGSPHCPTCGYPASPIEGIGGLEYLSNEKDACRKLYRSIYRKSVESKPEVDAGLLRKIKDFEISKLSRMVEKHMDRISYLNKQLSDLSAGLSSKDNLLKESLIREQRLTKELEEARSIIAASKPATANPDSSKSDGSFGANRYSVWVTFLPASAARIVERHIREFKPNYGHTNLKVTSFRTQNEALALRHELEQAGATVRLEANGKPMQ